MAAGIPVKLLCDSVGAIITVELENGDQYVGTLDNVEDNMNMHLSNVENTTKHGKKSAMSNVFLRGSCILLMQLPDHLKTQPALQGVQKPPPIAIDNRGKVGGFGAGRMPEKKAPVKRSRDDK